MFTAHSVRLGAIQTLPVALSVFAYGMVYGLLTREANMSLFEAALASGLVFAGSAQFVALDMWVHPLHIDALIFTTLIVNLRHVLMGASLEPWMRGSKRRVTSPLLFFMVDESWALTYAALSKGKADLGFLLGSGVVLWFTWMGATLAGRGMGAAIPSPELFGLDFAFTAVFLALLSGLWKGRSDIPAWTVAALAALAAHHYLPGKWYIVVGGLAGSLAGLWRVRDAG
jgi:4-azaleucine resistance transporter AzlC